MSKSSNALTRSSRRTPLSSMLKWALIPFDSASECFWKLLPTPESLTVVRFREPNMLQNTATSQRGNQGFRLNMCRSLLVKVRVHLNIYENWMQEKTNKQKKPTMNKTLRLQLVHRVSRLEQIHPHQDWTDLDSFFWQAPGSKRCWSKQEPNLRSSCFRKLRSP